MKVYIKSNVANANAIYDKKSKSMKVLKGSSYRIETLQSQHKYLVELQEKLEKTNIISDGIFNEDYNFNRPSPAASIILGRPSNGNKEWVDENGESLESLVNREYFIDYLKENLNTQIKEINNYIKLCEATVQRVTTQIPLESLKSLPIEKWDKRGSRESLTYIIERDTNEMLSGHLGFNQNKLFFQNEDLSYGATNNIMNSVEGSTVEAKFDNFIVDVYNSIVRYSDEDYLENNREYALVGANVLFIKLLSFYRSGSVILMASPTYYLRIFEYLGLGKISGDTVIANIVLKRFLYEHLEKDTNIYAISYLVYDFYNKYIEPKYSERKTTTPPVINDEGEEVDLDHIFVSDNKITEILNLLNRKQNIILQGVPGVGKTFIIKSILKSRYKISDENYQVVQIHQSYSYEEFIEGLRPNGGVFEVMPGLFKTFAKRATNDPGREYFFIIDEINRGNLSKIFGELLMLIESDKRENYSVKLPYSGDEFTIPKNLYIIGTMNTADRSLSLVDYALRRRFAFVTLEPAFGTEKFNKYMVEELEYSKDELNEINMTMSSINKIIKDNLSDNFKIGHSYFITEERSDKFEEFISEVYKYEILPLVEEYFFDDDTLVNQISNKMRIYE